MEIPKVSPIGAILFIAFSLAYLIVCFIVQYKIFNRRCKQAELFCEQAEQDGRMVTAHRKGFRHLPNNSNRSISRYAANYTYIAPDGKKYKMRWWDPDCRFSNIPPDTMVLYLEKWNYRKYYTQSSLSTGKHGSVLQMIFLISGFLFYFFLFNKIIMPYLYL